MNKYTYIFDGEILKEFSNSQPSYEWDIQTIVEVYMYPPGMNLLGMESLYRCFDWLERNHPELMV